jgi:hypothetical protein
MTRARSPLRTSANAWTTSARSAMRFAGSAVGLGSAGRGHHHGRWCMQTLRFNRCPIQVKGKGELVTWLLLGRNDGSGPTA